jgi:hypothetical protein
MKRLFLAVLPGILAACAATPSTTTQTAAPVDQKEYRTGSRIPVREPVASSPTTTVDPSALRTAPSVRAN